jgi:5-hydroxyisourate hydrolase
MPLNAEVLDGVYGRSATGVRARLQRTEGADWSTLAEVETNGQGVISDWGPIRIERGQYRICFDTDRYFASFGLNGIYSEAVAVFRIHDNSVTLRVQATLAPYSYSFNFNIY